MSSGWRETDEIRSAVCRSQCSWILEGCWNCGVPKVSGKVIGTFMWFNVSILGHLWNSPDDQMKLKKELRQQKEEKQIELVAEAAKFSRAISEGLVRTL